MPAPRKRPRPRYHHHVYVFELHDRVWNESSIRAVKPDYQLGKPFVCVGMTGFPGVYYILAAKPGLRAFLAWTVATRSSVIMVFAVLVSTRLGPAVLLLFGAVDLAGAFWTWAALRRDAA